MMVRHRLDHLLWAYHLRHTIALHEGITDDALTLVHWVPGSNP
jgi:hypothetical protein